MKVTLFAAMSANGMIARENGKEDFLSDENWESFCRLANKAGCIIWGRKTYDNLKKWDKGYLEKIKKVTKIVLSSEAINDVLSAKTPEEAINILNEKGFEEVLLAGGSETNSSFAEAKLVDEMIINIESVIVSKGILVFSDKNFDLNLQLLDVKNISKDIIQLRYKVQ